MGFATPAFLTVLLPAAWAGCFLLRRWPRVSNVFLALISLAFYAAGEALGTVLLLGCAAMDYGLGRAMQSKKSKGWLAVGVCAHLLLLGVFKYAGFAIATVNDVFGTSLSAPALALPIGISFFTFQGVSYLVDVYRGETSAAHDPVSLTLYLSFFPQLVAGPIVRWDDFSRQLSDRRITAENAARGLRRMIIGLSKKVLLADGLAAMVDAAFGAALPTVGGAWLGAFAFTMQLYLDFSGYTDMALGMGQAMGFSLPENFRLPLCAGSLRDFWRRWHMTLTGWFRSYVYLPLGGNRQGQARTMRNILVVFLLTGLWHGAGWTFVLWGLWHGLGMCVDRALPQAKTSVQRALRYVGTLLFVIVGFCWFRADSVPDAVRYLGAMLGLTGAQSGGATLLTMRTVVVLLTSALVSFGVLRRMPRPTWLRAASYPACLFLLALCYAALIASGYHPFLYFRF